MQAARNYIEFFLVGGSTRLMRASLSDIERALAPSGFLRTHRSWLVNTDLVRAITAVGSGDYRLALASGLEVPLSRRFPEALAQIRAVDQGG